MYGVYQKEGPMPFYQSIEEKLANSSESVRLRILKIREQIEIKKTEKIPIKKVPKIPVDPGVLSALKKISPSIYSKALKKGIKYLTTLYRARPELKRYVEEGGTISSKKQDLKYNTSPGEQKVIDFLKKNKIKFIREKNFEELINPKTGAKLFFDFWIPSKNYVIEYDGKQHYEVSKYKKVGRQKAELASQQHRDKVKNDFCRRNGIIMLRIPYYEYFRMEDIMKVNLLR